jgi:hypothetical protein
MAASRRLQPVSLDQLLSDTASVVMTMATAHDITTPNTRAAELRTAACGVAPDPAPP